MVVGLCLLKIIYYLGLRIITSVFRPLPLLFPSLPEDEAGFSPSRLRLPLSFPGSCTKQLEPEHRSRHHALRGRAEQGSRAVASFPRRTGDLILIKTVRGIPLRIKFFKIDHSATFCLLPFPNSIEIKHTHKEQGVSPTRAGDPGRRRALSAGMQPLGNASALEGLKAAATGVPGWGSGWGGVTERGGATERGRGDAGQRAWSGRGPGGHVGVTSVAYLACPALPR